MESYFPYLEEMEFAIFGSVGVVAIVALALSAMSGTWASQDYIGWYAVHLRPRLSLLTRLRRLLPPRRRLLKVAKERFEVLLRVRRAPIGQQHLHAISRNQSQSVAINRNQSQSIAISRNQSQSVAITVRSLVQKR
jgi:hypothetical protein